jgi:hypothetical protein
MRRISGQELAKRVASRVCNVTPDSPYGTSAKTGSHHLESALLTLASWASQYRTDDAAAMRETCDELSRVLSDGPLALPPEPPKGTDILAEGTEVTL